MTESLIRQASQRVAKGSSEEKNPGIHVLKVRNKGYGVRKMRVMKKSMTSVV